MGSDFMLDDARMKQHRRWERYFKRNKERVRKLWRESYWRRRDRLLEIRRERERQRRRRIKALVIQHYGGRCVCCGEDIIEFLSIDHIGQDGSLQKRRHGIKGGTEFYCWIIKNNFPEGFRVLCYNCNKAIALYGICPHSAIVDIKIAEERKQILRHYSWGHPLCSCCGEANLALLSIDHINGGGSRHFKQVGWGTRFYKWVFKNNFPDGFQVLCFNCNLAKGFYGYCPHRQR